MSVYSLTDLPERMQSKIRVDNGCWIWTGARNNRGYGSVSDGRRGKSMLAHRKSYSLTKGEIGLGLEIDHLCENPPCVNPAHLEAVTPEEHKRRIGHLDLKPVYASQPRRLSADERAAWGVLLDSLHAGMDRRAAMSEDERAIDEARRHRLHLATGTRCQCSREAVSA